MTVLALKKLVKKFDETLVVKGVDLEVSDKEFVVFVGPSGCGKSTILRMVAGLEDVSEGEILIGGKDCTFTPSGDRGVAMVFQDYALYPHMSVYENMAFGLRIRKLSEDEVDKRVKHAAEVLGLGNLLQRRPAALSGGQRQRVAMGRAFVKQVGIYLFDEPLSNLDAKLRAKMRLEIKKFHREVRGTVVYVTHDQLEAMTLADRIVVLNQGEIEQVGTPLEIFDFPRSKFVATFIGSPAMNILEGEVKLEGEDFFFYGSEAAQGIKLMLPRGKFPETIVGRPLSLGVRPSDLYVTIPGEGSQSHFMAKVEFIELLGKNAYITFSHGPLELVGEVMGRGIPELGKEEDITLNLQHAHLFDVKTGLNVLHEAH